MRALVDTRRQNLLTIIPFVALLISVWVCVAVLLWSFSEFEFLLYYMLLYVSFLGVLELASSLDLRLPSQKWLNFAVAFGFFGWVFSLILYFR